MGDSGAVGVSARMVGVLGGSSTKHHASGIWWHPTSSWWSWHQKNMLGWPTIEWPLLAKVRKKSPAFELSKRPASKWHQQRWHRRC